MPTYEYFCANCDETTEYFHSMKETPNLVCKECGAQLKKLLGAGAGLIFKGSGFYATDYKKSSKPLDDKGKKSPSDESSTESSKDSSNSSDSSSSESKPSKESKKSSSSD